MTWYTTGTITLVQNSDTATGDGTQWLENVRYGDILMVADKLYEVVEAKNDVQLTLTKPYTGATVVGQPYALIRNMTNASNYDLIKQIDTLLTERTENLDQFAAWMAGTVNGGPASDGRYPLTNRVGSTIQVYCPAKMASLAGADQTAAIQAVAAQVTTLNTLLSDYSDIEAKVEAFTGITLESLGGQASSLKLSSIAALTFDPLGNEFMVSINDNSFAKFPISDRALSLLAAETPQLMRTVLGIASGGSGGGSGSGGEPGRRVAIIGTSLCQLCNYGTATELSQTNRSWIGWAMTLTNQRMIMPIWRDMNLYPGWEAGSNVGTPRGFRGLNAGVSSDHSDNILNRASYLVANVDCDFVIIDSGINDIGNNSLTSDDIALMREQTADYLLANGKTVILLPLLSPAAAYYPIGSVQRRKMQRVNNRARQFCQTRTNLYFFDWTEYMMNFNDPNGQPKPLHSVDGLHFAPRGAFAVGKGLADLFTTLLPKAERRVWSPEDLYDGTLDPYGNLMQNPFCYGSSGTLDAGATGFCANGMRIGINSGDGSVVGSMVARADGRGQWQQLVVTPGTAETQALFRVSDIVNTLPAGTWVQASAEVECDAWDGWKGINIQVRDLAVGGITCHAMKVYDGFPNTAETWAGTVVGPAFQIVGDGSLLRWRVEATSMAAATGKGTVRIGAVEFRPVQDPKIIVNAVV
jgi:hypothetical protein